MNEKLNVKGVKFKALGELCEIRKGKQINRSRLSKTGQYPVMNGGTTPSGYWHEFNTEANTIIVSNGGAAGYVNFMKEKFWASGDCFVINTAKNNISLDWRFLYHALKNKQKELMDHSYGTAIKHLNVKIINNFKIPFPSLETQKQIAKILDTFAELTAELTARKKQYKYYRDLLINKKLNKEGVEYKTLGELCKIKIGKQLNRILLSETGEYPVMNGGINPSGYWHEFNCKANTITFSQGGENAGHVNFLSTNFWAGAHCYYLENLDQSLDIRFLYHFLKFSESKIKEMAHGVAIKGLGSKKLSKFPIPIFSLETQKQIANILDKFSTLCNDITNGLPAEIALNQKRYEYYRNKLLTFDEGE